MKIFPFAALVGQEKLKTALMVCAVNPSVGGLLVLGDKGTAKSTAARGLAEIMPPIARIFGCRFNCSPEQPLDICDVCNGTSIKHHLLPPPFMNLPLGATEDRVIGSIDFERALKEGKKVFQPGLLAQAHRGILYIDEVNLLSDHLVDVLLDVAAMGINSVEREGVSVSHPAKFALIGTMNLEEGELRPQLLDRFGMMVEVDAPKESEIRAEVVRRRIRFEEDTDQFSLSFKDEQERLRKQVIKACDLLKSVRLADRLVVLASQLCSEFGVQSLRADLVVCKVARTLAALNGRYEAQLQDIQIACQLALPHRFKRRTAPPPAFSEERLDQLSQEMLDKQVESYPVQENERDNDLLGSNTKKEADEQVFIADKPGNPVCIQINAGGDGGRDGRRSFTEGVREGRFLRASPDPAPTKLAINATMHHSLIRNAGVLAVSSVDLHAKVESVKNANLILFVVDASGSMAALKRMELVKGTVLALLDDAYYRRDRVAVIAFRGQAANIMLPPTRSREAAYDQLKNLPTGGRTPLAHALRLSHQLLESLSGSNASQPLLILLTDGKANVPLIDGGSAWDDSLTAAYDLLELGVLILVIDTEFGYLRFSRAKELADVLKAEYLSLESVSIDSLSLKIRGKLKSNKKARL